MADKREHSPRKIEHYVFYKTGTYLIEKQVKCPGCREKMNSVDHMATKCDRMPVHDYMRHHNEASRCIHLQLCVIYGL